MTVQQSPKMLAFPKWTEGKLYIVHWRLLGLFQKINEYGKRIDKERKLKREENGTKRITN